MKKKILDFLKTRDYVSFQEMNQIDGFKGDRVLELDENLVLWQGISKEASQAILELIRAKKVKMNPSTIYVYLFDGGYLNLPIAKKMQSYKKPHWFPITLRVQ